jgi:hypothetical protein
VLVGNEVFVEVLLILKQFTFDNIRKPSLSFKIVVILLLPVLEIRHQMIKLSLPFSDNTFNLLILDSILLNGAMYVVNMTFELLQLPLFA